MPALTAGIGVDYAVGCTEQFHRLPAYVGALFLAVGFGLTYPYLFEGRNIGPESDV